MPKRSRASARVGQLEARRVQLVSGEAGAHAGYGIALMQLSPQERSVVDAIAARREALVTLTGELVASTR